MNLRTFFLLTAVLLPLSSVAEESLDERITPQVLDAFAIASFEHEGFTLPYRILSPEIEESERYPLLLFLHGYGERGVENQRQLIHGGTSFADPAFRKRHNAIVVAPQCPDGVEPGTDDQRTWTRRLDRESPSQIDIDQVATPQLAAAKALVDHLLESQPVDPDRVYVCGLSMGGYATWELATRYPDYWAAATPICGAGDPSKADRLTTLPIWNFHGDADNVIPVERSREMIEAIKAAGGQPIHTEYEGVGHNSWTPTLESRHVWDWVFAQRRGDN